MRIGYSQSNSGVIMGCHKQRTISITQHSNHEHPAEVIKEKRPGKSGPWNPHSEEID